MECLKFKLSGDHAFFKKPDFNSEKYFTYNHIHKVALLGLLGAVIGLRGYNQSINGEVEFYDKLHDLQIGIVPLSKYGNFKKLEMIFTNTTYHASVDGNLVIKQDWLCEPSWNIYILDNHPYYKTIKQYLLNGDCEYIPYLGSNDHFAEIDNVEIIQPELINKGKIDSLFFNNCVNLENGDSEESEFLYTEYFPIKHEYKSIGYIYEKMNLTDMYFDELENIYKCNDKNVYFY